MNTETIFEVQKLSYQYPGEISALDDVSFTVGKGEMVGLVGANGSGKSTLIKILDGLLFPSGGEIIAFGSSLSEELLKKKEYNFTFRSRVGLVFQDPDVQLFSPTVWDDVVFGPLQLGLKKEEIIERAETALSLLGILHLKNRPPYLLSGGEKKKAAIASVLSMQPEVLLLDEPTAGLDPWSQGHLIDFLLGWGERSGGTLVFSTQDLDLVEEIATRILVMTYSHRIAADGNPEDYLTDSDFLLGTNLMHQHSHRHKEMIHRHPHQHEHRHQHD